MKKYNILQLGIFKDHNLGGDYIFNKGLIENNCTVEKFDYREYSKKYGIDSMYSEVLKSSKEKDIIFISKGEILKPELLKEIKKNGTRIILWHGDIHSNIYNNVEKWLENLLPYIDCFFLSQGGNILKNYFDIGKPKIASFYFNPSNPLLLNEYNFKLEKIRNITFTARFSKLADSKRSKVINYLKTRDDVSFFGDSHKSLLFNILSRINHRLTGKYFDMNEVRGLDYVKVIKESKIGIGVNLKENIPYYTSDRLTHYMMFGTFFMTYYFPNIRDLFSENELVYYENIEDLNDKINFYLKNEYEREKIARNGQKKILEEYNTKNIVKMMLEIFENGYSDIFPWVQIYK